MARRRVLSTGFLLLALAPGGARAEWRFAAATGFAKSLPTRLTIEQDGFPDLRLTARYDNRPFATPLHWMLRLSHGEEAAWELQHIHHKLFLRNRPPEVARFDISHGYNIFTVARSRLHGAWTWRAGAGVVIAHPESTVRGRRFGPKEGIFGLDQYLAGPAVIGGIGYGLRGGSRLGLAAEAQLTAAWARVPIEEGHATAPNVALHVLVGIEWRSTRQPRPSTVRQP